MRLRQALGEIAVAFIGDDDRRAGFRDEKIGAGDADIGGEEVVAQLAARFGQQRSRLRKIALFRRSRCTRRKSAAICCLD